MGGITRRSFAKVAAMGLTALPFGTLLTACSVSQKDDEKGKDTPNSQVIIAMNPGSEPAAGFDPLISWGCGEHVHEPLIQSTLITTDLTMNFVNDLATSYENSPDGMEWTFTIRNDVVFSDGTPLRASDVAFTINSIINSNASQADLSMVKEALATDETTVVFSMDKPHNALLYTLAVIGIVPEHAYDEGYGSQPIGSGRYLVEQWDQGQQIILVANPDYYGEPVVMKRVVVVFMEEDAALAAVQSGQVDVAFTSPALADQEILGYELVSCKTVDSRGISLPIVASGATKNEGDIQYSVGNDVTCDVAVRQAINCALDRSALAENVLNGWGTPAYSVCDALPWASEDMFVDYDVELALNLLDSAGWKAGADAVLEKNGIRASFDLIYSSNDSTRQALAAEFSNQMKKIGIEVNPVGLGWDDIYPRQYSDPVLWGWGSNTPTELFELNYSSGWGNYAGYANDVSDDYFDAALAENNFEESYKLWRKAQWDGKVGPAPAGSATWVWMVNVEHLYFMRNNLIMAAQKPHPHGHGWSLVNNIDQWRWSA